MAKKAKAKPAAKKAKAPAKKSAPAKVKKSKATDDSGSKESKKDKSSKTKLKDVDSIVLRKAENGYVIDAAKGDDVAVYVEPDAKKTLSKVKALLGLKE